MRRQMIEEDVVECVIGLGPNLFYNSPMEACLLIHQYQQAQGPPRQGLVINAVKEVPPGQEHRLSRRASHPEDLRRLPELRRPRRLRQGGGNPGHPRHNASLNVSLYLTNVDANGASLPLDEAVENWNRLQRRPEVQHGGTLCHTLLTCHPPATRQPRQIDLATFRFEQIARSIGERVEPSETRPRNLRRAGAHRSRVHSHQAVGTRDDVSGTKLRCLPRRRDLRSPSRLSAEGRHLRVRWLLLGPLARAPRQPEGHRPEAHPSPFPPLGHLHAPAVDISVGSLSPTINWKTLKTQQFLLPPKDQQAKLAELLWRRMQRLNPF